MNRRIQERWAVEVLILRAAKAGHTFKTAARLGGIHRSTLYRWIAKNEGFARRFRAAWSGGETRRNYRNWLNHPFRGMRPPTGKGTRRVPRYGRARG
ncbi:helix-turn-helix domain-containing protein [Haloferula chungangensis]|uniref:Helix-turn-helix domain-containing protein n=1 Tax=Haloferula chungangensis TaxID=1048331 RepID=A0ABW2L3L1_9BACT